MKPTRSLTLPCLALALALAAAAQTAPAPSAAPRAYRIEYLIREYDGAKLINARHYDLVLDVPERGQTNASVRVGNRVPIATGSNQYEYQSVGLNLDCDLGVAKPGQGLPLITTVSISNVAGSARIGTIEPPLLKNLSAHVESLVPANRPTDVASLDDVVSNHRYDIVVTAVPLP